jgi:hypothetical protein
MIREWLVTRRANKLIVRLFKLWHVASVTFREEQKKIGRKILETLPEREQVGRTTRYFRVDLPCCTDVQMPPIRIYLRLKLHKP